MEKTDFNKLIISDSLYFSSRFSPKCFNLF